MNVGVIVFPGSNCHHDCRHVFRDVLGQDVTMVWHKETSLTGMDGVILPGGFSYGDYHARALNCPGAPAAPSITAVFSVITGNGTTTGPATTCNNVFSTIPVGAAAQQVCTFNVP